MLSSIVTSGNVCFPTLQIINSLAPLIRQSNFWIVTKPRRLFNSIAIRNK